ncbi:MAG TPA: hypothetical protein VF026_20765 [Ktedonobacteraceae bacterium]
MKNRSLVLLHEESDDDDGRVIPVLAPRRIARGVGRAAEGFVNKLKLIKRQGYGRASFPLLRQRVLHAL